MHRFHKRAVGVTDPHRCRQLAGKAHKPGITIVFRRSRFARRRLTDAGARAGTAFNDLIEDVIDLGDIFGVAPQLGATSSSDDLRAAMLAIQREGRGAIVYLRPEGSGEDYFARLQQIRRTSDDVNAPDLTRTEGVGARAMPMDSREFGVGGQILRDLGLSHLRVLTNHPRGAMPGLSGFGLEIVEQVALR